MEKRGISPLIAIVVLIAFLVVLSILTFSFTRQFFTRQFTFERIEGAEREKLEYEATIETAFDINFATITRDPGNLAFRVGVENTGRNDIIGFKVRSYGALGIEATDIDADLTFFNKKTVLVIPFPNIGKIQSVELIPEIILNGEEFIVFESRREMGVNDVCAVSEGGLCSDGIDNDCDGLIDQNDGDCQGGQQCNNDGNCDQGENLDNCPNDCPPLVCSEGEIRACNRSNQFGTCTGQETCTNNAWQHCTAQTPTEEACGDGIDNDCDSEIDENCEAQASNKIVVWFHSWSQETQNIYTLGRTGFVSHLLIANLDFSVRENSDMTHKIPLARNNNLGVIWSRSLWFRDANTSSKPFAQPFMDDYTTGNILYNADYYEWFLKKLQAEAELFGIPYTAIDSEPYDWVANGNIEQLKQKIFSCDQTCHTNILAAINEALSRPDVKKADYIFPDGVFPMRVYQYSGYDALSALAAIPISENTYFDCDNRLEESLLTHTKIVGAWATPNGQCHRDRQHSAWPSCILEAYDKTCPLSRHALWGPHTLFDNLRYWYDADRGLFLYAVDNDSAVFPQALLEYCQENYPRCEQYHFSG